MDQFEPPSLPIVLVVDDEPLLRMMAVDLVEEAGFQAVEASDADAALAIFEARTDIAVLFTDIRMPGSIDGLELARRVATRWPSTGIILTSGHCRESDLEHIPGSFFAKPYDAPRVAYRLSELVEPPSQQR